MKLMTLQAIKLILYNPWRHYISYQQTENVETTAFLRFAPPDPYVDSLKSFVPGVYTHTSL